MTNRSLAIISNALSNYNEMCRAIDTCYQIDEVKLIVDKSIAMEAWFKQIEDIETERKFIYIKFRAWRQMGKLFGEEIKTLKDEEYLHKGVKTMGVTTARYVKRVRDVFGHILGTKFSDSRITELVRMGRMSDADFETTLASSHLSSAFSSFARSTPQAEERDRLQDLERAKLRDLTPEQQEKKLRSLVDSYGGDPSPEQVAEEMAEARANEEFEDDAEDAKAAALEEATGTVGMTFKRYDRETQRQFAVIMRKEHHDLLHKIKYEQRITMWEVLRRGLKLYAEQHGYEFPVFDEDGDQKEAA